MGRRGKRSPVLEAWARIRSMVDGSQPAAAKVTAAAPTGPSDLIVVWRDNSDLGAFITTRKHPDSEGVNGPECWPRGIAGYYLASHCRPPVFHPSAIPHLPPSPAFSALLAAAKLTIINSADLSSATILDGEISEGLNAAIELAGGFTEKEHQLLEDLALGLGNNKEEPA